MPTVAEKIAAIAAALSDFARAGYERVSPKDVEFSTQIPAREIARLILRDRATVDAACREAGVEITDYIRSHGRDGAKIEIRRL